MPSVPWDEVKFTQELEAAAGRYERERVGALCQRLIDHLKTRLAADAYPAEAAKRHLSTLRRKRYFEEMLSTSDALIRSGQRAPEIRCQHAQALLDSGLVSAALSVLHEIERDETEASEAELAEVRGLIGRAYKQIYVDAHDPAPLANRRSLENAIRAYLAVYRRNPESHTWHGVNAASLLWRAREDGVAVDVGEDAEVIAGKVLAQATKSTQRGTPSAWDLATAAEASVVVGDFEAAARHLEAYVNAADADAFEIASTLRQFEEVLLVHEKRPERAVLLDLLRGGLLRRGGGTLNASGRVVERLSGGAEDRVEGLEALLGGTYHHHSWLLLAMTRAAAVARIRAGTRGGTGFLVPGRLLSPGWDFQVLLTNNHVVSRDPALFITMQPDEASVGFDALAGAPKYRITDVLFESAVRDLDVTCCRLDRAVEGVDDYAAATWTPRVAGEDRVYVIGHPLVGELSYSLRNNFFLASNETRIHYRSPTEKGSSGSPLFNEDWELIGIHHAGGQIPRLDNPSELLEANEGIPIDAVVRAIRDLQ